MPPKAKKSSKTLSRLNSEQSAGSPRTPLSSLSSSSSSIPRPDFELGADDFFCSLDEASSKFPSLIRKSAFVGRVTDVETDSKGCKIWLSEPSMVASSIVPGSIVSVSLPSPRKDFSDSFPLSLLADECSTHFGVDSGKKMADEAGSYFALATVFPSCKVLKNGVRLSSNLSNTMGCPAIGRVVFVYPVQRKILPGLVNGNHQPYSHGVNCLSVHNCKELHLELAPLENKLMMNGNLVSSFNFSAEKVHDEFENGFLSSPRTPLYQPKLSSPNTCGEVASPNCDESVSKFTNRNISYVDSFNIEEVLGDESGKKLMQTCAASWLYSRCLLRGNLVSIPILSKLCIFHVINARKVSMDCNNKDSMNEGSNGLIPQALETVDHENNAFLVDRDTRVFLSFPLNLESETTQTRGLISEDDKDDVVDYIPKLGGLSKEYAVLKDIIISSSVDDTLSSFGLRTTKGVLLHGPPGTGKTSLVHLCAHDAGVNLFSIKGPEIVGQYYGESEQALLEVFESASRSRPAVIFIDELDAIAPARKDGGEELSQRMVATLLHLMDGISRTDGVLVLAATNRPDGIEPALRRPGRLDREIELGVPSSTQRFDILHTILNEMEHTLSEVQIQNLAMTTHGFVGADIAALCNEAALVCLRLYAKFKKSSDNLHSIIEYGGCSEGLLEFDSIKGTTDLGRRDTSDSLILSDLPTSSEVPQSVCFGREIQESKDSNRTDTNINFERTCTVEEECMLKVTFEDFEKARLKVRPSAMREVILEVPKVNWEDVGGQEEVKIQLMEAVEWPQKHQDALIRIGTRPPTGVLMFGPPGCSKTLMARAVASEAGLNFLAVKGPELFSKWVGESEKAVRSLFAKARANAPSIIFFDEIDALAVIRGKEGDGVSVADRVMSQLLVELDGLHERVNVTVIAATNRPDKIDPALLRPGRFDRLLYVGLPNESDREEIFRIHLRRIPCCSDVNTRELACLTEGCTGADISLICREAAVAAIEENLEASEITMAHLRTAVRQVQPSEVQSYRELSAKFQRLVHSSGTSPSGEGIEHQQSSSKSKWFRFW